MARTFLSKQLRAAERETERRKQQQSPRGSSPELLVEPLCPSDDLGTDEHPVGVGYPTGDPAALESYEDLGSNMLMGLEEIDQLELEPVYLPNQGIAPSEFLPSDLHGPRIQQVDACPPPSGETDVSVSNREAPPPLTAGSTTPTRLASQPLQTFSPGQRNVHRSLAPQSDRSQGTRMSVDTNIPAQDELTTILEHLQGQWLLFVNAKESNNYRLMRIALNQAISTQDTLTTLFGTQRMLEVSDGWLARDELARMERMYHIPPQPLPQTIMEQPATRAPPQQVADVMEQTHSAPLPRPSHPDYLAPQTSARQPLHQRPPPPPPPPPAPHTQSPGSGGQPVDGATASPRADASHYWTPARYPPTGGAASLPPSSVPGQEAYYGQDEYYYPPQHPPHAYTLTRGRTQMETSSTPRTRGSSPSRSHDADASVGSFFMRAERMINRSQRRRDRGRMPLQPTSSKQPSVKSGH
ncbi:hypothetical protein PCASD_15181 [Puccinia coronata f. sp. avenae]|uniref:Uncharacterized protein n=1 Tax=Puccinia coronata f. sp. avenae TaxID=200324 RepID=A0A2N5U9P9_9BASI|nr:hypothetical protein PCASD_15181 [Puccinia coronata f. sp. avenae]